MSAKTGVSRVREPEAAPEGGSVPVVQPPPPSSQDTATGAKAPRKAESRLARVRREPASVAWEKLSAPLRKKRGIRVGALGITGSGKTTGTQEFLAYLAGERLVDIVVVHDVKLPEAQYIGPIVHEATELETSPPENYPAIRVMRRKDAHHMPDVEAAADLVKTMSYDGVPSMLVLDELRKAVSPSGREFSAPTVGELVSEGLGLGASILWLTQLPQRVPLEAFDQSELIFYLTGDGSLSYLVEKKTITAQMARVIGELRPAKKNEGPAEFVLVSSDEGWDGIVYEVPKPKGGT